MHSNNIKTKFGFISTNLAWEVIQNPDRTAIDAIVEGCSVCERDQCDGTVGYGGSPDENSDVALDALLIDGYSLLNEKHHKTKFITDSLNLSKM